MYTGHRFPAESISYCVWRSSRFPLSYRDIQETLLARGATVTDASSNPKNRTHHQSQFCACPRANVVLAPTLRSVVGPVVLQVFHRPHARESSGNRRERIEVGREVGRLTPGTLLHLAEDVSRGISHTYLARQHVLASADQPEAQRPGSDGMQRPETAHGEFRGDLHRLFGGSEIVGGSLFDASPVLPTPRQRCTTRVGRCRAEMLECLPDHA